MLDDDDDDGDDPFHKNDILPTSLILCFLSFQQPQLNMT